MRLQNNCNKNYMTQYEKLLKKFLENPANIDLVWLIKILEKNWYESREWKWSHKIYKKWETSISIAIHNNDCKLIYKKKVKEALFDNNK